MTRPRLQLRSGGGWNVNTDKTSQNLIFLPLPCSKSPMAANSQSVQSVRDSWARMYPWRAENDRRHREAKAGDFFKPALSTVAKSEF